MTSARTRRSFVVQVHVDGAVTLENVRTRERRPIYDLGSIGEQISVWMEQTPHGAAISPRPTPASGSQERRTR